MRLGVLIQFVSTASDRSVPELLTGDLSLYSDVHEPCPFTRTKPDRELKDFIMRRFFPCVVT